jgi:hypothetical protein
MSENNELATDDGVHGWKRPVRDGDRCCCDARIADAALVTRLNRDFSDFESVRVLDAAANALARELGRQAAREWFDGLTDAEKNAL